MRLIAILSLALLAGCGVDPGTKPDAVDIAGKLTVNGKPVGDVNLTFQVITTGSPAEIPVKNGEFKSKMTPGRYTWFLSEGRKSQSLRGIPPNYLAGDMNRTVDIDANSTALALDIK